MYKNIFDTHAHYDHRLFNYIRHAILSGILDLGVSLILNCGSNEDSSFFSADLSDDYPFIYSAAGIHPHAAAHVSPNWKENIKEILKRDKVIAVGEIGLDYHYNFSDPASQRKIFREQLELAVSLNLPVIVHDRNAHNDIMAMIKEYRPKGVIHRFSGSTAMMEELIDLGLYLGYGCSVVSPKATNERESITKIPLNRLLLETDCPYLSPPNKKDELCTSDMISYAAETISELRPDYSPQEIIDLANMNGKRLFGINL